MNLRDESLLSRSQIAGGRSGCDRCCLLYSGVDESPVPSVRLKKMKPAVKLKNCERVVLLGDYAENSLRHPPSILGVATIQTIKEKSDEVLRTGSTVHKAKGRELDRRSTVRNR